MIVIYGKESKNQKHLENKDLDSKTQKNGDKAKAKIEELDAITLNLLIEWLTRCIWLLCV